MDDFFVHSFTLKGKIDIPIPSQPHPEADHYGKVEDLGIIAMDVEQCTACGLDKTRKNPVPGEGGHNARIVFVGEAPGADEDTQGRPFVGRAGQLLTKIIGAMGLKREDVFICNILKCRPPDNRAPKPDEIIKCIPFLHRQLEIIDPDIVVALGAHAAKTLLKTNEGIGKLRGRFHDLVLYEGAKPIKLMPTYHPAYLLRNYSVDNRKKVWEDIKKVLEELGLEIPQK